MHNFQTTFIEKSKVEEYSSKGKKHVALVGAGMSAERLVSISSTQGVAKALIDNGYKVTFVDMGADIATVLQDLKPDIVYNCLHGTYGEDGCLQGLLNILRIPYTHSGLLASCIAFSKAKSKILFNASNIAVAKNILVNKNDIIKKDPLPRPYVIKPLTQGSSIGVELVFEDDEFSFADYDFPYGDEIMIEEYIQGREMQVAVLNGKALGALEIKLLQGKRFYDYETKYTEGFAEHLLPAQLPEYLYNKLLLKAEIAFNTIGCRGLARVEFIYSELKNDFIILEVNTHPGMTPLSICPEIAASVNINFNNLIEEVVRTARIDQ